MLDQAKAEAAMQVNFWSLTRLATVLVRQMMRAKDGRVVVIGSVTAERGNQGNAAYAASKAALLGYRARSRSRVASRNITVNYVAPGFIDTEMIAKYAKFREKMESQIPAIASPRRTTSPASWASCSRRTPPTSPAPTCRLTAV